MLKVAIGLIDQLIKGEGIAVLGDDILKIIQLVLVDHTKQHGFLGIGVGADGIDPGGAVTQNGENILGYLLGMGGNDNEFVGGFGSLQNLIAHKGGDEAVRHTKCHRLVIHGSGVGVYEKRDQRHNGIEGKGHDKEIGVGTNFVDVPGDDIGTAGRGIAFKAAAVNHTADHTADNNRINGVVTLGIILNVFQTCLLQQQKGEGIDQGKQQGFHRKGFLYRKIGKNTKGNVDQQGHVANGKAGFILHHGGNAVKPCRRKAVLDDEDMVVKGKQNCSCGNS